jgi:hypothetical protein
MSKGAKKKEPRQKPYEIPWEADTTAGRLKELDRLYAESDARIAAREKAETGNPT